MDLSKLLGDLYETDDADTATDPAMANAPSVPPTPRPDTGPEWATEERLDEAFASWRPGPPDDAPAAEREMADAHSGRAFPQLEAALASDALFEAGLSEHRPPGSRTAEAGTPSDPSTGVDGAADATPHDLDAVEAVAPPRPRVWTSTDDDVLPHARRRRGGPLSLLRR